MAQTTFDICTECGKETEVTIVDDVTMLCEKCLDDLDYIYCDNCEEYWLWDVIKSYELKDGRSICEHCYEALLEDGEITEDDVNYISGGML